MCLNVFLYSKGKKKNHGLLVPIVLGVHRALVTTHKPITYTVLQTGTDTF